MPFFEETGASERPGYDVRTLTRDVAVVIHDIAHLESKDRPGEYYYHVNFVLIEGTAQGFQAYTQHANVAGAYIMNQLARVNPLADLPLACCFFLDETKKPFPHKILGPQYPVMLGPCPDVARDMAALYMNEYLQNRLQARREAPELAPGAKPDDYASSATGAVPDEPQSVVDGFPY